MRLAHRINPLARLVSSISNVILVAYFQVLIIKYYVPSHGKKSLLQIIGFKLLELFPRAALIR